MKQRLQRILSILCVLALVTGCMMMTAFAEDAKVSKVITVQWEDEDDYEAQRPAGVTMSIDGQAVTLNAENNWTAEALADEGTQWSIADLSDRGYFPSVAGGDVTVVRYTRLVAKTNANVTVVWNDNDNAAGLRPESVRINLLADGVVARTPVTVPTARGTATWETIPVNKPGTTEPITYSIAPADEVPGYSASVIGGTVTYTLLTGGLKLSASVAGVPEGADVSGLKLTVTGPDPKMPVTLTYGSLAGGAYDFGEVIPGSYVLQENNADSLIEGYVMDPAKTQVGDAVYVAAGTTGTLTFRYTWKAEEEETPNLTPMEEVGKLTFEIIGPDARLPMTVTYADFTGGRYELSSLAPGEYAVIERNPEGLVRAYSLTSDSVTGMTVTVGKDGQIAVLLNKYEPAPTPPPEVEKIDIPVTKIWNDNDNEDGNRPTSITVNLFANGAPVDSHVLTVEEGWQFTFKELDRYDEAGNEIVYTVNENPVEWYTATVNGYFITNTYTPEVTSVSVAKIWDDDPNNQIRPSSIAVTLLPVGEIYMLTADNGWDLTVDNLPTRLNGQAVAYSWREQEVVGYVNSGVESDGVTTIFTNHAPQIPEIPPELPQPARPGAFWFIFEEYETALGGELLINHVGDCFD